MISLLRRLFHARPQSRSPWLGLLSVLTAIGITLLQPQPSAAATPRHYTDLEFPPLPDIELPDSTRIELDNGMVVYLVEDHELPLISGSATIQIGSRFEPADQIGLAALTGELIRTGGTRKYNADEIDATLEQIAASVETSINLTVGTASFSALSEDTDTVFELFAEILQHPVFDADKLELAKNQFRGGIARRNDDPNEIADRELNTLIYGASSPYARTVEYATLDPIERRDLLDFYTDYVAPDRIILGLVGDFETEAMQQKVIEQFGRWSARSSHTPKLPEIAPATVSGIYIVDRPDLSQSYVTMGHIGGLRSSADYAQLGVMNNVLNGFGGRLFDEVRSRQGLAYTVYAAWSANYDYPGLFIAGGQTRAESTANFIQSVRSEIERIRNEAITPEELQAAKDKTLNSFIFNFADPAQTLSRFILYEYYGYPSDFIFQYQRGVEETTIADVQRVAQTYLAPEDLSILIVGNAEQIKPSLDALDPDHPVQTIDISIPGAS
jgi:zinc protease